MIKSHYPELFVGEPDWAARVDRFCAKVFELVSFLNRRAPRHPCERGVQRHRDLSRQLLGPARTGHPGQPRALLASVEGLTLTEMADSDVCCGFGGTFCVKYPDISNAIVEKKAANIVASGADTLLAGDLGCLMNMAGKLQREGRAVNVRHVAEVLAGVGDSAPIGQAPSTEGRRS